jgi:hypothetical protein
MPSRLYSRNNARSFKAAAKALRKAQPLLFAEIAKDIKAAGDLVAKDAKTIAGEHSTSIPPTIVVRRRGLTYVAVQAGGVRGQAALAKQIQGAGYGTKQSTKELKKLESSSEGLPLAGLYELGNKGARNAQATGTFRHPVFKDDTWVNQPRYAFLVPAGEKNKVAIEAIIQKSLDRVAEVIVLED